MTQQEKTHFGAREVAYSEKAKLVRDVFSSVAPSYDRMNQLMSLGLHHCWKQAMVQELIPGSLLDLASGTGDIVKLYHQRMLPKQPLIFSTDINPEMLREGRDNLINANILQGVHYACANAECLPFESNSFDNCTIAFGIRNVTDIPAALREMHRVLKPGGKCTILEFSKVHVPALAKLYQQYSTHIIPKMGKLVAGNEAAYRYLVESIERFPGQEAFKAMITEAGFSRVRYHNLTFGVVALHTGWKI